MIPPEDPPPKANLKTWWHQLALGKPPPPSPHPFQSPYKGPFILSLHTSKSN